MIGSQEISVVIPVLNEQESVETLYKQIISNLNSFNIEIIFINDGSTDNTKDIICNILNSDPRVKLINFNKNYGKATALSEGFKISDGDIVITIDGDLQDDPSEIPSLIDKINQGWDLVSGWKKVRKDSILKIFASKIFNFITRLKTGIKIHDFNCGLKAYRRRVVKSLKIYGHLHRFIPVLAHNDGYKVTELAVRHYPRKYGYSKYGKARFFHGFYDFLTVIFLDKYLNRPMHFFGKFGILFTSVGFAISTYLTSQWIVYWFFSSMGEFTLMRPLFFLGILFIVVGVQFFSIGFIGEMIVRKSSKDCPLNMEIFSKEESIN